MVKFIDINPDDIDDLLQKSTAKVSYPIFRDFIESGKYFVELDMTEVEQSVQGLRTTLSAYARNHNVPAKVIMRGNHLYLKRLDVDKDGNEIPDWRERQVLEDIIAFKEVTRGQDT